MNSTRSLIETVEQHVDNISSEATLQLSKIGKGSENNLTQFSLLIKELCTSVKHSTQSLNHCLGAVSDGVNRSTHATENLIHQSQRAVTGNSKASKELLGRIKTELDTFNTEYTKLMATVSQGVNNGKFTPSVNVNAVGTTLKAELNGIKTEFGCRVM